MADWKLTNDNLKVGSDGQIYQLNASVAYNRAADQDPYVALTYALQDISQSHHFKINLSKIKVEYYAKAFGYFLPVKNISYNEITFENMSIPVGIFGNFPLMHKRHVGTINLTLYDRDTDNIEQQIRNWEAECFPRGKYVNYISEIVGELKYASYTVTGKLNQSLTLYVIPTGSVTINRSYEENNAKLLQLSLAIVGFQGDMNMGLGVVGQYDESLRSPSYYPEGFPSSNSSSNTSSASTMTKTPEIIVPDMVFPTDTRSDLERSADAFFE